MAENSSQVVDRHHDVKQWQHCSLFNLDLFNDDNDHHPINLTKDIIDHSTTHEYYCSISTPNVDDTSGKQHFNHACPFNVLQKNYTTQLEHVAQKLLATDKNSFTDYCSVHENNDTKGPSLNQKILLGSTAILDNFLRNNLKTPLLTNSINSPTAPPPPSETNTNSSFKLTFGSSSQRRWHSERGNRHPKFRANLPLTNPQRQVLERYINYPLIKPSTTISSTHRHELITGKVIENTGTALSAFAEQTLNATTENGTHSRPLSSTSSAAAAVSHHSILNRHCSIPETNIDNKSNEDYLAENIDNESISSELDQTSDEETAELDEIFNQSNLSNHHLTSSETLLECLICYELKRLQKRTCCDFLACSACLNSYVEQQIKEGIIRIQCPNQDCHIYMHRDEIHKRCLSPELRQKFTRFLIDNNRAINIKTCPRCSNIHEIDLELCRSMRRAPTKVQCVECNLIWCFQCHSPWHDGIQCKEFRRGDRMLKKWAREVHYGQHNAQQCPSCKVYIQRTKGCDHIVCLRCKTEFCYKCGDRFRDIIFIGDHYSELSVLGCKYRFCPDDPLKRRLIRGSILGGKILAAPVLLCLAVVAGAVCAGIGLPTYCCLALVRQIKARRRRRHHAKLKEPVLMSYKTLNTMVPQLIPREPVNIMGMKAGFNSIRSNIQDNLQIEIDPTSDAPIAVFDECDINTKLNQPDSIISSSFTFTRLDLGTS
ncbi:hypothetical protein I4U23_009790 [Adineta vaga]|nr:hypothetical protein I4U23_009790 [Adineta vaga]